MAENKADNKIELKSISELLEMKFFIPNYQRGYRWTEQQVKDLLNDIWEFSKKKKDDYEFYCLQPLVVKEIDEIHKNELQLDVNKHWYEVIDGQQRLTTIYLILSAMKDAISILGLPTELYELKYQRTIDEYDFTNFLKNVGSVVKDEYGNNIEHYHVCRAYLTIKEWLNIKRVNIGDFCNAFLKYELDNSNPPRDKANNIRFIWYESVDEDPVRVFRRLNNGKIKLTDAELVKALMLNRSNFGDETDEHLKLRQQEIASEWDNIEYALQNDEFWLFLRNIDENDKYKHSTRIDFIFDLMCEQQSLGKFDNIGTDEHRTFRYFYEYFHTANKNSLERIKTCWDAVKKYFQTFQEWYNDLELYHYVGYLIGTKNGEKLQTIVDKWNNSTDKKTFVLWLKEEIKAITDKCPIDFQFKEDGSDKGKCKPVLLFHNIQTVINQNRNLNNNEKYQIGVFYKFPFHLYKREGWHVEHIDSNTTNPEEDEATQKEWILNVYLSLDKTLQNEIYTCFENEGNIQNLYNKVKKIVPPHDEWTPDEKNRIWNYTLLDSSTNESYGNSIFSGKRRVIIGKDKGVRIPIPKPTKDGKIQLGEEKPAESSFVPPCTKQVFMKYFSATMTNPNYWTMVDAQAYKLDIEECLKKLDSSNSQNTENNEQ